MDFQLSEEQRSLVQTVRKFLEKEVAPAADELDRKGPMDRAAALEFIAKLKPFGYVAGQVPREDGGDGISHLTYGILLEEMKKVYASLGGIASITASCARVISELGSGEQKKRFLPALLGGTEIGCMGITEPEAGSDVRAIKTKGVVTKDKVVLNGTKMWISNGSIAGVCVVFFNAFDEKGGKIGPSRVVVERGHSPFESREIPKMGLKSFPTAEIVFDDCEVPAENILGIPGKALSGVKEGLNVARANLAAGCAGLARGALDIAKKYVMERRQFGREIGRHQIVQAMIADMEMLVDASRLLAYRALSMLDAKLECTREASIAKAFASESAVRVTSQAIQLHGAYGLAEEFPVERYFRDARCYTIPDGTTEIQKLIIGREVLGAGAFK
ncbi:MAG: acyl-CoA dehydrogenase family protein [bacterium]